MKIFNIILFFNLITSIAAFADERELTAEAVDVWAEGILGEAVKEQRLLGAVVSVVRDGKILYQRGFSRAHVSREDAVDPVTTGFRIGSITKTFTAMIISQLVDEGKIKSLHDPVNKYLKGYNYPIMMVRKSHCTIC